MLPNSQVVDCLPSMHMAPSLSPSMVYSGIMAHACNSGTQELEAGGSKVQGCPWLHHKFNASLGDMRSWLKNKPTPKPKAKAAKIGSIKLKRISPWPRFLWLCSYLSSCSVRLVCECHVVPQSLGQWVPSLHTIFGAK